MRKLFLFVAIFLAAFMFSCSDNIQKSETQFTDASEPMSAEGNIIPNQYIIQLKTAVIKPAIERLDRSKSYTREEKGAKMEKLNAEINVELSKWLENQGITKEEILNTYTAVIVGAAIKITPEKYQQLITSKDLASVEHDRMEFIPDVKIESIEREGNGSRAQTTPCGITNAGGSAAASTTKWAWVVDSGIDMDHPDLNVVTNTTFAKSFVGGTPEDCNGHGTHVAGTIGAKNNTIGVIGVAANAPVVPVRVFGCSGGSPTSTIVSGINHVATYDEAGDVLNLSLGGYYGSGCATGSAYRTSIQAVADGGTRVAIASGNNMANAALYQPACVNGTNIFTVTNMRCNKTYYNDPTYGGNFGVPPVDWIATGTSVYSTYLNGGYATLTGTSMATPHVAGIMHIRNAAPLQNGTVAYSGVNYKIAVR